ncbi:unnamed protein product, partial [Mesorhabditis belari]|uniref:G-protein coupled receptors family 1 profile domain-containing protein n=1 Tax=Mesorhabditis belari TaxID=2138241 RepID=A0AAF3J488_9BILA
MMDGESPSEVYLFILPIIVTLGLGGNIISLVTIFHSRLRHISANVYLIVLTAADSVFLFGVLLICFKIDFVSWEWCVFVEYILMVASYVSSWATAALTIERYLAIAHPLKHVMFGHVDRWKMLIYWLPIPFILHLFQFINLVPSPANAVDSRKCVLREADYQVVSEFLDVLLCFVLPCAVVVILNLLVMGKVNRERGHFLEQQGKQLEGRRQGGSGSGGFTRILWVVPMVFVILNTPFYCIRMYEAFLVYFTTATAPSVEAETEGQSLYHTVYNAAHYLYYINFASDVVVYAFSSANFRKTVVIAWRRIICPGYDKSRVAKYTITLQDATKTQGFFKEQEASTRSCLISNSTVAHPARRTLSQKESVHPRSLPESHSDADIRMIKSPSKPPHSLSSIVHYHHDLEENVGNGSTAF